MTGKEEKPIMIIRNLSNEDVVKPHIAIANQLQKEKDELEIRLTKYKRAFEILNLNFTLICKEDEYLCNKEYYLLSDTYTKIEKEEAELIEELMNCGTKDN